MDKLVRVLRKELTRNKKKTAALGLVFAVALYFWVPFLWGLVAGNEDATPKSTPTPTPSPSVAASAPVAPTAAASVARPGNVSWKQLVQLRSADPRTRAVPFREQYGNPFGSPMKTVPIESTPQPEPEPRDAPPAADPLLAARQRVAQLRLVGTMVGLGRPVATINGAAYTLGETIEGSEDELPLVVQQIRARDVVVVAGKYRFRVPMQTSTLARRQPRFAPSNTNDDVPNAAHQGAAAN